MRDTNPMHILKPIHNLMKNLTRLLFRQPKLHIIYIFTSASIRYNWTINHFAYIQLSTGYFLLSRLSSRAGLMMGVIYDGGFILSGRCVRDLFERVLCVRLFLQPRVSLLECVSLSGLCRMCHFRLFCLSLF